jgi:hypothetical protein
MTCREFKHAAASLTLWELSRPNDEQILSHAEECSRCGTWLDRQQVLAAGLHTLQARTAGRQAGPQVERALLRMFRQVPFEATQPVAAHRSAPIAFRLSRFFEVGAYAAVVAAILVGLFLGVRLLEEGSTKHLVQRQSSPASATPAQQTQGAENLAPKAIAPATREAVSAKLAVASRPAAQSNRISAPGNTAAALQTTDDPDYVALMFCDPLSCSSDAQVVRMELPASGATTDPNAQPLVADVVVGDDGVVRAMRIVD